MVLLDQLGLQEQGYDHFQLLNSHCDCSYYCRVVLVAEDRKDHLLFEAHLVIEAVLVTEVLMVLQEDPYVRILREESIKSCCYCTGSTRTSRTCW